MLILSRKEKESIQVGNDIEITICRVVGGRVKLGLRAPQDVTIRRGELVIADELANVGDADVEVGLSFPNP